MDGSPKVRHPGLWLALVAVVTGAAALWVFPRAMPMLALGQRLTRQAALQRADSFFQAHDLAPPGGRTAIRFQGDESLRTYLDLEGGGLDTLNAVLRGRDVALFTWRVRSFLPRDPHEARVSFATDGRVVGFRRQLAEADARPELTEEDGLALARRVLTDWMGMDLSRWRMVTSSYETLQASGRVDRTYTFERSDRKLADAPIRTDVVIAGDLPASVRPYVVIPESFQRRYGEMRSANDLIAIVAQVGMLLLLLAAAVVLRHYAVRHGVRWGPALAVGGTVGVLLFAAGINEIPGSWFGYDTATAPGTFQAMLVVQALLGGAVMGLVVGLTVAAAEAAARHALPHHLDWWKVWRYRGTREVAGRVTSGYVVALISFAYVGFFYLVTRNVLGWWVPSELLDDPNLISTPMPWLSGIAVALQAGVWEEALFRALPLSLLALWVRGRAHPRRWLALGVVATALVFGFSHANYASWPPYSRGVEIFLDACFWAVLFLWLGLVVTVIAHFAYDLVLFGLFAASGTGLEYRITAVVTLLVLLAPVLAVVWRWLRQRRLDAAPPEARFSAWSPAPVAEEPPAPPVPAEDRSLTPVARRLAWGAGAVTVAVVLLVPTSPTLGPAFTASRSQAVATADSMARAHGVDPGAWRLLSTTAGDTLTGWARFLTQEHADSLAQPMAATYNPPAWWVVRYVRTGGTVADRAEEWRIRVRPDGSPLDVRHIVPDSARGDTVSADQARRIARTAIAAAGLDTLDLQESDLVSTERPARRDVTLTYTDTTVALPGDASAKVRVTLAGDEPLVVRRVVELPEAFQRAQRERSSTHLIIALVCLLLFAGVVTTSVVVTIRRRPPALGDVLLDRNGSVRLVGILSLAGLAEALNSLPSRLYPYSTAMPWSNWVGTNVVVTLLAGVVPALVVLGLWMAVSALRRRVGIPLVPRPDAPGGRRDVLLAGLGLGSVFMLARMAMGLAGRTGIPAPPSTNLEQAVPVLTGALALPMELAFVVTLLAIVGLALAGVSRSRGVRWAVAILAAAPLLVMVATTGPADANPVLRVGSLAVTLVVAALAVVRLWGASWAWAWIVAGLMDAGFAALRVLAHAPTVTERGAGVLTLATAAGLLLLVSRVRPPAQSAGSG